MLKAMMMGALALTVFLGLSACGSKGDLESALKSIPAPVVNPDPVPAPEPVGKNNRKEFTVARAGLSPDPYLPGMYQLVLYKDDHGSACYGLGDVYVKLPVSQARPLGRQDLRAGDRGWNALFYDGSISPAREYRESSGYLEIFELNQRSGKANLMIGSSDSGDFLRSSITFENCLQ